MKRSLILQRARDKKSLQEDREHELYKAMVPDPRRQENNEWLRPPIKEDE